MGFWTRSGWVALLFIGVGTSAWGGDAFTRVDGQVIAPLPADPTTVLGLEWYPVGFDSNLVPSTSGTPISGPLTTGTTGIVALRYRIDAPESGTTWQALFTRPDGSQTNFQQTFTWYPATSQGCLAAYTNGRWEFTDCRAASSAAGLSFRVAVMYLGPCLAVGAYTVTLSGADVGASYSGGFEMVAGSPRFSFTAPAVLQLRLPQDTLVGTVYDEVPAGTGTVTVRAVDAACPNIPAAGELAQVRLRVVPQSGGHSHLTTDLPPTAVFQRLATVVPGPTATWTNSDGTLFGSTGPDGTFSAEVTAGEAAGSLVWTLDASSGSATAQTELDAQLGLVPMVAGGGFHVDGSPLTPPCGDFVACGRHENNHYAAPAMAASLPLFADLLSNATHQKVELSFNDMSLEKGGVFDILGELRPPHSTHRRGTDVDILYVYHVALGTHVGLDPATPFGLDLRKKIKDAAGYSDFNQVPESGNQIHYRYAP